MSVFSMYATTVPVFTSWPSFPFRLFTTPPMSDDTAALLCARRVSVPLA